MRSAELCAGYGGLALAIEEVFNAETAWVSEFEEAPSKILAHHWKDITNYGDMTKIDWYGVESVDVLGGGTPCQDLSHAGRRKGMTDGTRSNLWVHMREAIAIIKPTYVVWENVRGAYSAKADSDLEHCPGCMGDARDERTVLRALGRVLGDLSDLGYDAEWRGLRASDVGACHGRFRVFVLARRRKSVQHPGPDAGSAQYGNQLGPHNGLREPSQGVGVPRYANVADVERRGTAGWGNADPQQGPGADRSASDGYRTALTEDSDVTVGGERRLPAPRQTQGGGAWPDTRGRDRTPTPDAGSPTLGEYPGEPFAEEAGPLGCDGSCDSCGERHAGHGREAAADAASARRAEGQDGGAGGGNEGQGSRSGEPERASGERIVAATDAISGGCDGRSREAGRETLNGAASERASEGVAWGEYEPAIRRWERTIGRPAPRPTEPTGRNGGHRLSPRFTEWMMGLPDGWVTDPAIGISRNEQLKACGNGVVPQQATAALRDMLAAFQAKERAA